MSINPIIYNDKGVNRFTDYIAQIPEFLKVENNVVELLQVFSDYINNAYRNTEVVKKFSIKLLATSNNLNSVNKKINSFHQLMQASISKSVPILYLHKPEYIISTIYTISNYIELQNINNLGDDGNYAYFDISEDLQSFMQSGMYVKESGQWNKYINDGNQDPFNNTPNTVFITEYGIVPRMLQFKVNDLTNVRTKFINNISTISYYEVFYDFSIYDVIDVPSVLVDGNKIYDYYNYLNINGSYNIQFESNICSIDNYSMFYARDLTENVISSIEYKDFIYGSTEVLYDKYVNTSKYNIKLPFDNNLSVVNKGKKINRLSVSNPYTIIKTNVSNYNTANKIIIVDDFIDCTKVLFSGQLPSQLNTNTIYDITYITENGITTISILGISFDKPTGNIDIICLNSNYKLSDTDSFIGGTSFYVENDSLLEIDSLIKLNFIGEKPTSFDDSTYYLVNSVINKYVTIKDFNNNIISFSNDGDGIFYIELLNTNGDNAVIYDLTDEYLELVNVSGDMLSDGYFLINNNIFIQIYNNITKYTNVFKTYKKDSYVYYNGYIYSVINTVVSNGNTLTPDLDKDNFYINMNNFVKYEQIKLYNPYMFGMFNVNTLDFGESIELDEDIKETYIKQLYIQKKQEIELKYGYKQRDWIFNPKFADLYVTNRNGYFEISSEDEFIDGTEFYSKLNFFTSDNIVNPSILTDNTYYKYTIKKLDSIIKSNKDFQSMLPDINKITINIDVLVGAYGQFKAGMIYHLSGQTNNKENGSYRVVRNGKWVKLDHKQLIKVSDLYISHTLNENYEFDELPITYRRYSSLSPSDIILDDFQINYVKFFYEIVEGLDTTKNNTLIYDAKFDYNSVVNFGDMKVGFSGIPDMDYPLIEKIQRLAYNKDVDVIDIKLIGYLARFMGYDITDTYEDIIESPFYKNEDEVNKAIRSSIKSLPQFYSLKSTKSGLDILLLTFGIVGELVTMWSPSDDLYNDFVPDYELRDRQYADMLNGVSRNYVPTPHFNVKVDIEGNIRNELIQTDLNRVINAINRFKPINTVFDGLVTWLKDTISIKLSMSSMLSILKTKFSIGYNNLQWHIVDESIDMCNDIYNVVSEPISPDNPLIFDTLEDINSLTISLGNSFPDTNYSNRGDITISAYDAQTKLTALINPPTIYQLSPTIFNKCVLRLSIRGIVGKHRWEQILKVRSYPLISNWVRTEATGRNRTVSEYWTNEFNVEGPYTPNNYLSNGSEQYGAYDETILNYEGLTPLLDGEEDYSYQSIDDIVYIDIDITNAIKEVLNRHINGLPSHGVYIEALSDIPDFGNLPQITIFEGYQVIEYDRKPKLIFT